MSNPKHPKQSYNDYVHATIKGGLSAIPFVGGIASEFFGLVVISPLQKRQQMWLEAMYTEIDFLKEKDVEYKIENLQKNENFISIVTQASQQSLRNHKVEKLGYLKNAAINSVISEIDFEDQVIFLNYVESFTQLHMKTLIALEERGINGIDSISDQLEGVTIYKLNSNASESKKKLVLQDLDSRGLIEKKYSFNSRTNSKSLQIKISGFGIEFLKFIRK